MESPSSAQDAIYGQGGGPPMLYETPRSKPLRRRPNKRRKWKSQNNLSTEELLRRIKEGTRTSLVEDKDGVSSPSDLPGDFPRELAFRALAAYSFLRTFSVKLRLSPFTPTVFLRALYLPYPNKLLGQVHVTLLRILLQHLGYSFKPKGRNSHKRRSLDNVRLPLRGGDNLTYLDGFSWPLFYDDYCHLTADVLWTSYNDERSHIDMRMIELSPICLEEYQYTSEIADDDDDSMYNSSTEEREHQSLPQVRQSIAVDPYGEPLRGSLPSRNRVDIALEKSYSESEYGDSDDEDGSDVEPERSRKKKRKRKNPDSGQLQRTETSMGGTKDVHVGNTTEPEGGANYQKFNQALGSPPLHVETQSSPNHNTGSPHGKFVTSVVHVSGEGEDLNPWQSTYPAASVSSIPEKNHKPTLWAVKPQESHTRAEKTISSPTHGHNRRKLPLSTPTVSHTSVANGQPRPNLQIHPSQPYWIPTAGTSYVQPMYLSSGQHMVNKAAAAFYSRLDQNALWQTHMNAWNNRMPTSNAWAHDEMKRQNGKAIQGFSASSTVPVSAKRTRKRLIVDDDVARTLRNTICGVGMEAAEDSESSESKSSTKGRAEFEHRVEKGRWIHFQPLQDLRTGVPYHRLSLEHKLVILEFLIDELLSLDGFADDLARRRSVASGFQTVYGMWPTDEEFENLDNGDECGVCNGEGELLCCDGCIRSYHHGCLDMPADQQLPDGKWLCPECRIVDPALLGPLTAGSKASLDWFSLASIRGSLLDVVRPSASGIRENNSPIELSESSAGGGEENASSIEAKEPETDGVSSDHLAPDAFPNEEFLIIHGYVFQRSANRVESSSVSLLSSDLVSDFLGKLDPQTKGAWPLLQVPKKEPGRTLHFPASKEYMMPAQSYDPSLYVSKYRHAPMPLLLRAGGGVPPKTIAIDEDSDCYQNSISRLSESISRNFGCDAAISKSLLSEPVLYDPYFLFREYLTGLEGQIRKACLLDEFWEGGKDRCPHEVWLKSVRTAKSINKLARLFLHLVDRVHPRAFSEGWFQNLHLKDEETVVISSVHFADLPADWTEEKECRKRIWEKTAPDAILHICERQGCPLDPFVQGIKEQISPLSVVKRGKRKRTKFRLAVPSIDSEARVDVQDMTESTKDSLITELPPSRPTGSLPISMPMGEIFDNQHSPKLMEREHASAHLEGARDQGHKAIENVMTNMEVGVSSNERPLPGSHTLIKADVEETSNTTGGVESVKDLAESSSGEQLKRGSAKKTTVSTRTRARRSTSRLVTVTTDQESQSGTLEERGILETAYADTNSIDCQIDLNKIKKIPKVEKIAKGSFEPQQAWPLAGRIPFPTAGNLPPTEMKRLARHAGVVKAPYVAYGTSHEVGQVCFAHGWRQDTEKCKGHDELAVQIRILESFLDRQIIHSCESVVRRGKNQIQRLIKLSQRDPSNGVLEHFVVSKTTMKGCWISSEQVDISALTLDSFTRRQHQITKRSEYLKAKAGKGAVAKGQAESMKSSKVTGSEERRTSGATPARQEKAVTTTQPKPSQKVAVPPATAPIALQHGKQQAVNPIQTISQSQMTDGAKRWTEISCAILLKHQTELVRLAKHYLLSGIRMPEYRLGELRKNTLSNLKGIGFLNVPEEHLIREMILTEEEGLRSIDPSHVVPHQADTHQPRFLSYGAPPSNGHGWANSVNQSHGVGVNMNSTADRQSIQQPGLGWGFPNASQHAEAAWQPGPASMAGTTRDLLNSLGHALTGQMPHQGSMAGAAHVQRGFDNPMQRTATTSAQYAPQNQQLPFEQQYQHNPVASYPQQQQLNQLWNGLQGSPELENLLRVHGGQTMGQQQFWGHNQHNHQVPREQIQHFLQQQQWHDPQSRGSAYPGNNGFR